MHVRVPVTGLCCCSLHLHILAAGLIVFEGSRGRKCSRSHLAGNITVHTLALLTVLRGLALLALWKSNKHCCLSACPPACLAAGDYSDAAVEEFARAVRRTPPSEQLDRRLLQDGLQHLDSRGLAALLKELARAHQGKRAREVSGCFHINAQLGDRSCCLAYACLHMAGSRLL